MKRKRKRLFKRSAALLLACFILIIHFLPVAAMAEGSFRTGTFTPGTFSPGEFSPGTFNPGTFTPGAFDPGAFSPGQFTPGQFTPGQFTPGQFSPGQFSPGQTSPGQTSPGQTNPGQNGDGPSGKPGEYNGDPGTPSPFNPPSNELPKDTEHPEAKGTNDPAKIEPGDSDADKNPPFKFEDDPDYQAIKFITKDMLFPALQGLDRHTIMDIDWNRYGDGLSRDLAKGIVKNRLESMFKGDSALSAAGTMGLDVWSAYDNTKHISNFLTSPAEIMTAFNNARTAGTSFGSAVSGGAGFLTNATKPFNMGTGIAGKAAPWMAAISTGISGAETIMNFANGKTNDGIASLGETLMSGAVVLSATGVGAPVAAGVAVLGGVLWAGAKIYKHRESVKKIGKSVGNGIMKATKATVNAVKGGVDAVKSGLGKVAGWFG